MTGKRLTRLAASVVVGVMLAGAAWGQVEVEWERTYGGDRDDICYSMIPTSDGCYAMAGYTSSKGAGQWDFWVVKTNAAGEVLWDKNFGLNDYDYCTSIIKTDDGGFALAGTISLGSPPGWNDWLIKTDANGDSTWSRDYGGNREERNPTVIQTSDGGYAVAGSSNSYGNDLAFWLLRTDGNGDSLWARSYWPHYGSEICTSICETSDGGFALLGWADAFQRQHDYDLWLVRTNSEGEVIWNRLYGGAGFESSKSLVQLSNGGFAIFGDTESFGAGGKDLFLLITDAEGDSLWSCTYGGQYDDIGGSILQTPDGGYLLAGCTGHQFGNEMNFLLTRIDSNGEQLWSSQFGPWVGGWWFGETCISISLSRDGGYIMAGSTWSNDDQASDFYLVKTTPDPVSVRDPSLLMPYTLLLEPAYPNPVNSTTRIGFSLDKSRRTSVMVFDPLGRRVAELIPSRVMGAGKYEAVWDAAGVPAGEYLIRLQAGRETGVAGVQVVK